MSDKRDELARQILEKTQSGKLRWTFVPGTNTASEWTNCEKYCANFDEGFGISISRESRNDDKLLVFELVQSGRTIFTVQADNLPRLIGSKTHRLMELRNEAMPNAEPIDISGVARFRLFSDLFSAAKESAVGGDQTIETVQRLLERIG